MEWIERLQPDGGPWTRQELQERHASEPAVIGDAVRVIGHDATSWAVASSQKILTRLHEAGTAVVPRSATSNEAEGCEIGLLTALIMLRKDHVDADMLRGERMIRVARHAFHQGLPLDVVLRKIWASHAASQDELLAAIERLVPPAEYLRAIQRMNQVMFTYGNAYTSAVSEAYERERRAWRGQLPEDRRRLLLRIIDGETPPADADSLLGASLDGAHVHAAVWANTDTHVPGRDAEIDEWALTTAERLGASRVVTFPHDGLIRIWWTCPAAPDRARLPGIADETIPAWMAVAIGPPGTGIGGFRDAFHGATAAARVGQAGSGRGVWSYDRVALLGLAMTDPAQAGRFVRSILGALAADDPRTMQIRETVRLYLAEGNSRIAVAKLLNVAPTTVAYRVAQAAELRGEPVASRALELGLALEIAHHFPDLLR